MSNSEKGKLSQEELLRRLDTMLIAACFVHDDTEEVKEEIREAFSQIRTMIKQNQSPDLEIAEEQYMAIVMDLYERIAELEGKPDTDIKMKPKRTYPVKLKIESWEKGKLKADKPSVGVK